MKKSIFTFPLFFLLLIPVAWANNPLNGSGMMDCRECSALDISLDLISEDDCCTYRLTARYLEGCWAGRQQVIVDGDIVAFITDTVFTYEFKVCCKPTTIAVVGYDAANDSWTDTCFQQEVSCGFDCEDIHLGVRKKSENDSCCIFTALVINNSECPVYLTDGQGYIRWVFPGFKQEFEYEYCNTIQLGFLYLGPTPDPQDACIIDTLSCRCCDVELNVWKIEPSLDPDCCIAYFEAFNYCDTTTMYLFLNASNVITSIPPGWAVNWNVEFCTDVFGEDVLYMGPTNDLRDACTSAELNCRTCEPPFDLECILFEGKLGVRWKYIYNAIGYQLEVTWNDPACCNNGLPTSTNTYNLGASVNRYIFSQPGSCMSWRVRSKCQDGSFSEWSALQCYDEATSICGNVGLYQASEMDRFISHDEVDVVSDGEVSILPNPNNGSFQLSWDIDQGESIEIIDIHGRVVYRQSIDDQKGQTSIHLKDQAAGSYFLLIRSGEEVKIKRLFIQ